MARRGITKPADMEAAINGTELPRPTNEEIAARAYSIYVNEGQVEGRDMDHWLRAEAELVSEKRGSAPNNSRTRLDSEENGNGNSNSRNGGKRANSLLKTGN
jgi:hypothetical protein